MSLYIFECSNYFTSKGCEVKVMTYYVLIVPLIERKYYKFSKILCHIWTQVSLKKKDDKYRKIKRTNLSFGNAVQGLHEELLT